VTELQTARGTRSKTLSRRLIAWIIDAAAITVLVFAAVAVLGAVFGPTLELRPDAPHLRDMFAVNTGMLVLDALVATVISAVYVVVPWSTVAASPGQLLLGLRVVNPADGCSLTVAQSVRRWLLVFPPFATVAALLADVRPLATLVWAAAVAWYALLLVTTALSETSQGLHDRLVRDVVRTT
jgi:uncharacterized RDD family membrane protein YckC